MARKTRRSNAPEDLTAAGQVKAWRRSKEWTQEELEQRAGLAHNAISRIENSEVSPRLETLEKIASAMEISIEQLQFGSVGFAENGNAEREELETLLAHLSEMPRATRKKAIMLITELIGTLKGAG